MDLNKKLAEWAGWYDITSGGTFLTGKHKHWSNHRAVVPRFTQSLDACFEWLVPKCEQCCVESMGGGHYGARVLLMGVLGQGENENPALALCKAIEKLVEEEVKDARD